MIQEGILHLSNKDIKISYIVSCTPPLNVKLSAPSFHSMVRIIANQQLSDKAAATIFARLLELVGGNLLEVENAKTLNIENLRSCGLSKQKCEYILGLREHVITNPNFIEDLKFMSDEAAEKAITAQKGFGKWSAQVFLLFHLGRMNILPEGDVTLNKAFFSVYGEELGGNTKIIENWAPYKSLAARYLWHWWDNGQPALPSNPAPLD